MAHPFGPGLGAGTLQVSKLIVTDYLLFAIAHRAMCSRLSSVSLHIVVVASREAYTGRSRERELLFGCACSLLLFNDYFAVLAFASCFSSVGTESDAAAIVNRGATAAKHVSPARTLAIGVPRLALSQEAACLS